MTEKRRQNMRVKQIVIEITGDTSARVTSGRGTAHNWWYITAKADENQQKAIEKQLVKEHIVGQYFSDYGGGRDDWQPCVGWH